MRIYITSSARANNQITYNALPSNIRERVIFVVPAAEREAYSKFPNVLHTPTLGLSFMRQWILDREDDLFCLLDDDLTFATRRDDELSKFYPSKGADIVWMFTEIANLLDDYAHVSVSAREGANRDVGKYRYNARPLRILAYDTRVLKKIGARFDRLPIMSDFDMALQLLEAGYENIILNWIVHNQRGSNTAGGCSQYRTPKMMADTANKLQKLHRGLVTVKEKVTKSSWGGTTRTDVMIYWKRAYDFGKSKRSSMVDPGEGEHPAQT